MVISKKEERVEENIEWVVSEKKTRSGSSLMRIIEKPPQYHTYNEKPKI